MTFIKFLQKKCKVYGVSITDVMHFLEGDNVSVDIPMSLQRIYDIDVNNNIVARFICDEIIRFLRCTNDYDKVKSKLLINAGFSKLYKETIDPCAPDVFFLKTCDLINFYDDLMVLIYRDDSCRQFGVVDCPFNKKEMDERTPEENTMEVTIKTNPDQEKEKELDSLLQSIEL
jgi:hypothetical protein